MFIVIIMTGIFQPPGCRDMPPKACARQSTPRPTPRRSSGSCTGLLAGPPARLSSRCSGSSPSSYGACMVAVATALMVRLVSEDQAGDELTSQPGLQSGGTGAHSSTAAAARPCAGGRDPRAAADHDRRARPALRRGVTGATGSAGRRPPGHAAGPGPLALPAGAWSAAAGRRDAQCPLRRAGRDPSRTPADRATGDGPGRPIRSSGPASSRGRAQTRGAPASSAQGRAGPRGAWASRASGPCTGSAHSADRPHAAGRHCEGPGQHQYERTADRPPGQYEQPARTRMPPRPDARRPGSGRAVPGRRPTSGHATSRPARPGRFRPAPVRPAPVSGRLGPAASRGPAAQAVLRVLHAEQGSVDLKLFHVSRDDARL